MHIASRSPNPPEVRHPKRFAQQNLGAGAIHSPRASAITEGRSTPQGCGVQKKATTSVVAFFWWTRSDSNRRPPQCECDALPAALLAHSSAYWRNRFIIAQLPPLCNAKNCTNLAVRCPNRIARTAPRAFGERSFLALLAYFSKRFRRYPYPSAFIFA